VAVVLALDELDERRLTELLANSSVTDGATVLDVTRRPVGTGQVASCIELSLRVEGRDAPVAVVAKVPSEDPTSVATATAQHLYEREVRFYRELAERVAIRTPACHHADFDPESGRFLLLLESLVPDEGADQLDGLDAGRCTLAVRELAGLHAPLWGDAAAAGFVRQVGDSLRGLYLEVVPVLMVGFLDRYGDRLTAPARAVVEWLHPRLGGFLDGPDGPSTVTHGDFRTDNLLFGGRGGEVPLATVDWQTIGHGRGALDLAYLLTTSLDPEVRRAEESALLAAYLERLGELGVTGYDAAALRSDYARYAFQGVVMLSCAAMLVERTARGDEMFLTMIERCANAVDDLDARRTLEA
jgi:hypothetical protein